jgi:hypothetical protein
MGWWSEKYNDFTKLLIAAGRARQHHQQRAVKRATHSHSLSLALSTYQIRARWLRDLKGKRRGGGGWDVRKVNATPYMTFHPDFARVALA